MDKELRKKLEEIANTVELPSTIKYLCVCAAGLAGRKMEMEKPAFIRSKSMMTVNIWLMPEFAAGFKHRELLKEKSKEIESMLGDMYTNKLLVHGTVLDADGNKMSKTLGNVVDPIDQLNKFGLDAVRYYAVAGLSTYGNGCWSEKDLVALYNADLADNFGNLLARTLHLINTKKDVTISHASSVFKNEVLARVNKVVELWREYEVNAALRETNALLKLGNKYINDTKPWSKDAKPSEVETVLDDLHFLLLKASELYAPVLSAETNARIFAALAFFQKDIIFPKK